MRLGQTRRRPPRGLGGTIGTTLVATAELHLRAEDRPARQARAARGTRTSRRSADRVTRAGTTAAFVRRVRADLGLRLAGLERVLDPAEHAREVAAARPGRGAAEDPARRRRILRCGVVRADDGSGRR